MTKVSERHSCTAVGKTIRCSCKGQIAIGGTLHPLADLGIGFKNGKLSVNTKYNMKKIIGYTGFCMKCRKEGQFLLPGNQV